MVDADGISDEVIEGDQNVDIDVLESDADQQFETDVVVIDNEDDTAAEAETKDAADASTDVTDPVNPTRRRRRL